MSCWSRLTNNLFSRLRSDRGSVSPFIIILLPALVGFAGLAYDMVFRSLLGIDSRTVTGQAEARISEGAGA